MICPNCGKTIDENCIICPWCKEEIQVISAVDDLEEEILKEMVDEDNSVVQPQNSQVNSGGAGSGSKAGSSSSGSSNHNGSSHSKKKKKKKKRLVVLLVVIIVAVIAAVFGVIYYHGHSADYLLKKAEEEYTQKDYAEALGYLERIIALGKDSEDSLLLTGQVYYALGDYDSAETYFLSVIAMDPDSVEAYQGLLASYYDDGDMDSIIALKSTVTNPDILAIFEDYMVAQPELSVEGGTYEEYITVRLTAPKKGLTIYYTLDGSIPDNTSEKYVTQIPMEEAGVTVLTAVCMDENGFYSEPVIAEYDIEPEAPDTPVVSPDGGTFSKKTTVTVTAAAGCTIYYTWNNTTPTESSNKYTGPITVPEGNNILSVIAVDKNGMKSEVLKCNFIYYPQTTSSSSSSSSVSSQTSTGTESEKVTGNADVSEPTDTGTGGETTEESPAE